MYLPYGKLRKVRYRVHIMCTRCGFVHVSKKLFGVSTAKYFSGVTISHMSVDIHVEAWSHEKRFSRVHEHTC